MKGVVLAGGFGTRLRPLTYDIPKPMVPIVNVPIMEHNINLLKKYGIKEIIVLLYYQADVIKKYFGTGEKFGVNIKYHRAAGDYGTAGSVKDAQYLIGNDDFIIISGDVLTDFNLRTGIEFAKKSKALFTIFLTSVKNPLDYGIIIHDEDNNITKFLEKPSWGQVFSDQINTGIYICRNKVLDHLPETSYYDFSKDLFPKLMDKKIKIKAYVATGYWRDIGNITEYKKAHNDILKGKIKIKIKGKRLDILGQDVRCEKNVKIGKNVEFKGTVIIGENTVIEDGAYIENSVIGNNVLIAKNTMIKRTIIWDNSKILKKSRLHENIIGYDSSIGSNCYISEGAVISDKCHISNSVIVNPSVKIWPFKKIESGSIVDKSIVWGDKWNKRLFGNYGITGIANLEIHPEFAAKLGSVYGATIGKGNKVLIGRDAHKTSRMISRAFITGLLSVGVDVDHLSDVPLPVLRYQLKMGLYKSSAYIRMSPIDKQLMDIKFFDDDGFEISVDIEKNIERLYFREDYPRVDFNEVGNISYPYRIYEYYKEGYTNFINLDGQEKVISLVVDYTSGLTSKVFPNLLGVQAKNVTGLNGILDPNREAYSKDEYGMHVNQVSEIVKNLKLDLGFVIDTCGESFVLVDNKGHVYENEKLLILLTHLLLEYEKIKKIILPVNAPIILHELAKKKGTELIEAPVTLKFLGKKAKQLSADFVGTTEGAFMFPKFNYALDGMISVGKIVDIITKNNIVIDKFWKTINNKSKYIKEKIPIKNENKGKLLRILYENYKKKNINTVDGLKVYFNKGCWISIIPHSEEGFLNISGEYIRKDMWTKHYKELKELVKKENI
ncbi:NTP transferase domain-containing protein [bacterium]|nr:NTP transferase domain-containing protein [bacterium]